MKENFASHIWITDNEGRGYVCKVSEDLEERTNMASLSEEEKVTCEDFNSCSSRYSLENLNNLKFNKK